MTHVRLAVAVVLVSILIGYAGGCGLTPAQRVGLVQNALTATEAKAAPVREVVAQFDEAARQAQTLLADPNLPPAVRTKILEGAKVIEDQLVKYRPVLQSLDARVAKLQDLLAQAQAQGDDLDVGREIQTYGQGLTVGSGALPAPFNAVGALVGLATTLAGGVIGSVTRSRKDQAQLAAQQQQTDDIVHGIVGSVNALIDSKVVTDPDEAKKILKEYQIQNAPAARAAVRKAQGLSS